MTTTDARNMEGNPPIRYSVQEYNRYNGWFDLNRFYDGAKKHLYSVQETLEGARFWRDRYVKVLKRQGLRVPEVRIVRVTTEVVE